MLITKLAPYRLRMSVPAVPSFSAATSFRSIAAQAEAQMASPPKNSFRLPSLSFVGDDYEKSAEHVEYIEQKTAGDR